MKRGGERQRERGESLMALLLFSFEHDICNTFQGKSWESCYKAATLLLSVAPFSNFSVLCHFGSKGGLCVSTSELTAENAV